jgi:PPOX class probable F420-dependent enzyme
MDTVEIRGRLAGVRVARLATVDSDSGPHIVPITFALLGERTIVTPVDHKPKRTVELRRLRNIAANPAVAVLADHYADDWDELWWVRADGTGRIVASGQETQLRAAAVDALAGRYPQYRDVPPAGTLIVITVGRWSGWSATPDPLTP